MSWRISNDVVYVIKQLINDSYKVVGHTHDKRVADMACATGGAQNINGKTLPVYIYDTVSPLNLQELHQALERGRRIAIAN